MILVLSIRSAHTCLANEVASELHSFDQSSSQFRNPPRLRPTLSPCEDNQRAHVMTVLWHRVATTTRQISLSTPKTTGLAAELIATSAALQSAASPTPHFRASRSCPLLLTCSNDTDLFPWPDSGGL